MADFTQLEAQITRLRGVRESVVAFIAGVQAAAAVAVEEAIAANDNADLTAITDFSASLGAETDAFVAAITANPGPTEPPVEPVP